MAGDWLVRAATLAVLAALAVALAVVAARRRTPPVAQGRLLEHIEELRRRVLLVGAVLLAGTVAALTVRVEMRGGWPVPQVGLYDTLASQLFRAAARQLLPAGVRLIVTGPADGFMAQFSIAVGIGIAFALPVAVDQLARFVGPALQPRERRWIAWAVLPAAVLFLLGAAFGYAILLPITFAALYQFSGALGALPFLTVADFATFTLAFLAGCGAAFELPLVMALLSRVGLVQPRTWWRGWRHAVLAILFVAMVVTPDPTIVSQVLLAVPLVGLYVLGAGLSSWQARRRASAA